MLKIFLLLFPIYVYTQMTDNLNTNDVKLNIDIIGDVKFTNVRFDPKLSNFVNIAEEMAIAFGYEADLKIDKKLAELIRLRIAQKNECAYCILLHSKEARKMGISEAKVDNISSWYNSYLYSELEKATLKYSDILTDGKSLNFQEYHNNLKTYFNDAEIAEIAAIIINMNVWTRLKLAQGAMPYIEKENITCFQQKVDTKKR